MQYKASIEDRIFRRGVTDQEVQQALDLVWEYLAEHSQEPGSDYDWWARFEEFFVELSRALSLDQMAAVEIATDSMFVHLGLRPWSLARVGLAISRRSIAEPDPC